MKTRKVKIAPSILAADFTRLGEQVEAAIQAGAEYIHIDVMDGHFVPNLSMGPMVAAAIKPLVQAAGVLLDVHLMVEKPEARLEDFARAGADILTVHVETCPHLHRTIQQITSLGVKPGVTLNPATPLGALDEILPFVSQVLVMSVNPGFGGQAYIATMTAKIAELRRKLDDRGLQHVDIEVDGGVSAANAAEVAAAGANVLVVGSAIFNQHATVQENIHAIRTAVAGG